MSTIELRHIIIEKLSNIDDISFLKAIKTILDSKSETTMIALTPEQRNEIIESKKEVEQGLYINHEILNKEVSAWLNKR